MCPKEQVFRLSVGFVFLMACFIISGSTPTYCEETPLKYDIEFIKTLIRKNDVKSVEDFLQALPVALRSNYVLVHHSSSSQPASFKDPRVIAFSPDARFI